MYPINHKTVFVLDHSPFFGISSEAPIEFDFLKNRTPYIPLGAPLTKSLWTTSLESSVEYCRIVWDLFPTGKLVRFVASDTTAHVVNTWNPAQQNINHVMNAMSVVGIPLLAQPHHTEPSIIYGLQSAIEALSEPTGKQEDLRSSGDANLQNKGRVICITSERVESNLVLMEELFLKMLERQNKIARTSDNLLPIDHCQLVVINTQPVNMATQISDRIHISISPLLAMEVHCIHAALLSSKLSTLILTHYELASTTVTGIPMKEEQNASSSANYDVEIYHESGAHTAILKGLAADTSAIRTVKEGLQYQTVTLKWCTPRGCSGNELQNCTSMHRITPVDVNSRPSLCLINFLLNGRSVMLEMPRRSGGKVNSHLLTSHGGEIFIHSLSTARSVLEDPPSISEGGGGRVTDYRITDFAAFIKQNKLVSVRQTANTSEALAMISKMKQRLHRHTKYWPLTISSTTLFNMKSQIEPLPSLIIKETITDAEVQQCKQVIYNLIAFESKQEQPSAGQRTKGVKREELYKLMWSELETLLKNNQHTELHSQVYNCLREVHKLSANTEEARVELDQALKELDNLTPTVETESRPSVIRATTDSPMSPPPVSANTKRPPQLTTVSSAPPRTLFDMYLSITADKIKARPDFAGRISNPGGVARLYKDLKIPENDRGPRENVEA